MTADPAARRGPESVGEPASPVAGPTVAGPTREGAALAPVGSGGAIAGLGPLLRLAVRRDRVRVAVWVLAVGGLAANSVIGLQRVYPTAADRAARAELMGSPAAMLLGGPGYGRDDYTLGAMVANALSLSLLIAVSIMAVLFVVRHTRAEEESGRGELVRAAPVGRLAGLVAGLVWAGTAALLVGAAVALGLAGSGLGGPDAVAFGAGLTVTGWAFAALAGLAAQLNERARTASGLTLAVLGLAFLVRGLGDITDTGWRWLSPIAWAQQTRAYVDLRWWPLLLSVLLAAAAGVAALGLQAWRDFGAGLRSPRRGPAVAGPRLSGPLGLAVRLHRGSLLGWGIGLGLTGAPIGSLAGEVDDLLAGNQQALDLLTTAGGDLRSAFLNVMGQLLALGAGAFGVLTVLRWRDEETAGRAEAALAGSVPRGRWLGAALAVALGGGLVLLTVAGLVLGAAAAVAVGSPAMLGSGLAATLGYAPALAATVAVAAALYAVGPRWATWSWLLVGYAVLVGVFGGLLDLPRWAVRLSPYGLTPAFPAAAFDPWPLLLLLGVAAVLGLLAHRRFTRRDLVPG